MKKYWFLILLSFLGCSSRNQKNGTAVSNPYHDPILRILYKHRTEDTLRDGPRCILYPTCSFWAQRAYEQYGFTGLLLVIDRALFRENRSLYKHHLPVPQDKSRDLRYFDPLSDSLPFFQEKRPDFFHPFEDIKSQRQQMKTDESN